MLTWWRLTQGRTFDQMHFEVQGCSRADERGPPCHHKPSPMDCPADAFELAGTSAPTFCDDGDGCSADLCDGLGGCENAGSVSSAGVDYNEDGSLDGLDDS